MTHRILITGGAGFVGSHLAMTLRQEVSDAEIVALDNLHRRGSELNVPRLERGGVRFVRGDVRNPQDLSSVGKVDFLVECSAEPSVLAGKDGDTDYLIGTNLQGAINCVEVCRRHDAPMIFLSTSRVYPLDPLVNCDLRETATRFELTTGQAVPGLGPDGVSEAFPMDGPRSLYGGTKLAAEVMLEEYRHAFGLPVVIDRCGVLAGPWQFGKADQGIATFWLAAHYFRKPLKYIGFGGSGKQVRDLLHIADLAALVRRQFRDPANFAQGVFNVGGGRDVSASLLELTAQCQEITGNTVPITPEPETRYADIPVYLSDTARIRNHCGWQPTRGVRDILVDIHAWIRDTPDVLHLILT
jgi:CDP-paratose 2-epimerase